MSIFSMEFFCFLAVLGLVYFTVPKKHQWIVLLIASYLFYACSGLDGFVYILTTTVSTFLIGIKLEQMQAAYSAKAKNPEAPLTKEEKSKLKASCTKKKRWVLAMGLILNFGILAVVKYSAFVIENLNYFIFQQNTERYFQVPSFLLPLGISFYTFQSMGYLIDVYRNKVKADKNIFKFALFVSYFPQIIQGPIGRYNLLAEQLTQPHQWDYKRVKFGILRILWGLFKKLVIAERVAIIVNEVFANYATAGYQGFTVFIAVLLYGIQIYADFSGGMDMVFGVSEIFGITMTENFRRPFMACSVAEFWQRWHITLGAWLRDYVFYPLALSKPFNRMGKFIKKYCGAYLGKVVPTCIASFIVFFLVGIWHGADWKYVVYGLWQAAFVSSATLLEGFYSKTRKFLHINTNCITWKNFQVGRTILIVTMARYLSRADSLEHAVELWKATFSKFNPWVLVDGTLFELGLDPANFVLMILVIAVLFAVDYLNEKEYCVREMISRQDIVFRWSVYMIAIFSIIIFGIYGWGYEASNFIYQGF